MNTYCNDHNCYCFSVTFLNIFVAKLSNFKIYVGNATKQSEVCAVYPGVPTNDDIGKGILVSCSALARYVTVVKLSEDLQFCEMNVIGNRYFFYKTECKII